MPQFTFSTPPAAVIRVGTTVLGRAAGCTLSTTQECHPVQPLGSTQPLAVLPGARRYVVTLSRLLWAENAVNFYTLSNFSVDITRNGQKITFTGCQWSTVTEEATGSLLWEKATLTAAHRTEESA